MKKSSYLFITLIIAGALLARPVHAATSYADIDALLQSLIKQVQELQRQLAIMQKDEADDIDFAHDGIRIVSPMANEIWYVGDTMNVVWNGATPGVKTLSVHLIAYKGGRTEIMTLATGLDADKGYFPMTPTKKMLSLGGNGSGYAVELRGKAFSTESEQFAMQSRGERLKRIEILSPNGGERLMTGREYLIEWESNGLDDLDVMLSLVDDKGNLVAKPIVSKTENDGSYLWKIAEVPGYAYKLYIGTTDKGPSAEDHSDDSFKIISR